MKILVCGGRNYRDRTRMFVTLDRIHEKAAITTVVHGAARGGDTLAAEWAECRCVRCEPYPADWQRDGKQAGYIRNRRMLDARPDAVIAFPGGPGTAHMVRRPNSQGTVFCGFANRPDSIQTDHRSEVCAMTAQQPDSPNTLKQAAQDLQQ